MNLFYRKIGNGAPLLILHGLYGCSDNWMSVARHWSATHEVVAVDLRNHGRSPHDNRHSYPLMCADVVELLDRLNIPRCTLVGHSMGGKVAMHVAANCPQRIERLVVVDIAPLNYSSLTEPAPHVTEHLNLICTLLNTRLEDFSSREALSEHWAAAIPDPSMRLFLLKNLQRDGDTLNWRINLQAIARNLPHILNGMDGFDARSELTEAPTLFIKGERSDYLRADMLPHVRRLFPAAEMVTVADTGHWLHAEQPEAFLHTVDEWMKR